MGEILVRNLSDSAIDAFTHRANLKDKSLEQELRDLIEAQAHVPYTVAERVEASKRLLALSKGIATPLTPEEMREGLE